LNWRPGCTRSAMSDQPIGLHPARLVEENGLYATRNETIRTIRFQLQLLPLKKQKILPAASRSPISKVSDKKNRSSV
jgi:hypothetical protein